MRWDATAAVIDDSGINPKFLQLGPCDSFFKRGSTAAANLPMAAGKALDGIFEQTDGALFCLGTAGVNLEWKPPWRPSGNSDEAETKECVTGVERAVALIEKGKMAVNVARGVDGEE